MAIEQLTFQPKHKPKFHWWKYYTPRPRMIIQILAQQLGVEVKEIPEELLEVITLFEV